MTITFVLYNTVFSVKILKYCAIYIIFLKILNSRKKYKEFENYPWKLDDKLFLIYYMYNTNEYKLRVNKTFLFVFKNQ